MGARESDLINKRERGEKGMRATPCKVIRSFLKYKVKGK